MTGMGHGLDVTNSTIVSAFETALLHQGAFALLLLALVGIAWNLLRALQLRRASAGAVAGDAGGVGVVAAGGTGIGAGPAVAPAAPVEASPFAMPEPAARRLLRVAFGLLWIFDGVLQAQVAMPLGLPSLVVRPAAASSPAWVRHLVGAGAGIWEHHPVTAAASAVWIQVGVGLFLLVAPRGAWSRLAGATSACWGLLVWAFGEAFGGLFAPGLSWMFGAPGAALLYVVAGALLALPERAFVGQRLGRIVLRCAGVWFLGMALLQAWPGRGFWQGRMPGHGPGAGGSLLLMVSTMASTPQPTFLSGWLGAFASLESAHGFAVNATVVAALALIGAALVSGRRAAVRGGLVLAAALCLSDWVLVQDLGFLGGVGTDPNSMVPTLLLLAGGYAAFVRPAAIAAAPAELPARSLAERARRARRRLAVYPTYALRSFAAIAAGAIVLLGAVPMAVATTNPVADSILAQAVDGPPSPLDQPAPPFRLADQDGRPVSLASLRGRAVALTFLDPVCTSDCPLIAREMRQADTLLGPLGRRAELVAVVANPLYRATAYTQAFDRSEGMSGLRNWLYLTGSLPALRRVWNAYGIQVAVVGGGSMVAHNDAAYVIGPDGTERYYLDTDPGSGSAATMSSFAGVLAGEIRAVLR